MAGTERTKAGTHARRKIGMAVVACLAFAGVATADPPATANESEARPEKNLAAGGEETGGIGIVLWPDQPSYRPRDLVTFNVRVDKACHLTLIGVDGKGQAIVLFPNELEPENLIAPSVAVRIPGHEAGYQFRFDVAGEETVIAICQRHARRPEGIAHDFERQRFSILGDWHTFLGTAAQREKEIRAKREAAAARRKRRGRAPVAKEAPPIAPSEAVEGRATITITIEPGG